MFRLRKIHPPYGTEVTPFWEFAYSEQVKVVNGLCEVDLPTTRDFLLNMGFELIDEIVTLSQQPIKQEEPVNAKEKQKPRPKGR